MRYPGVKTITTDELEGLLSSHGPVKLLDCRAAEEFEISRIPGAERIGPAAKSSDLMSVVDAASLEGGVQWNFFHFY